MEKINFAVWGKSRIFAAKNKIRKNVDNSITQKKSHLFDKKQYTGR